MTGPRRPSYRQQLWAQHKSVQETGTNPTHAPHLRGCHVHSGLLNKVLQTEVLHPTQGSE